MLFVDILNCETSSLFRNGVAWGVKFIQGEGQIILSGGEFLKDETPPKKNLSKAPYYWLYYTQRTTN